MLRYKFACRSMSAVASSVKLIRTQDTKVLEPSSEDLSAVVSNLPKAFNLAAYVNNSELLQNLLHLNVNLSKIEKKPILTEKLLRLKFQDIQEHIVYLQDIIGLDSLGNVITKNPMILCERLDDLQVRINYLESKHFTPDQIHRIISINPFWLMFSTFRIDKRLGFFQETFDLTGNNIRFLATKQPKLITYKIHHILTNNFVVKEEMGFSDQEIKRIILSKPKLWMMNQLTLVERFKYIHNTMKIPHETLVQNPGILLCRNFKIKQRHTFLEKLGRAQYNPTKENFVPIMALAEDDDIEFCRKYAKCTVKDYNIFLKTIC